MWLYLIPIGIVLVFVIGVWREPRRMAVGVVALTTLVVVGFATFFWGISAAENLVDQGGVYVLLGAMLLVILVSAVLGVFLILNGLDLFHREGVSLAHSLSLLLGLGILGYMGVAVAAVFLDWREILVWLLAIAVPLGVLAYGFSAFLLYSWLYQWFTRHLARPANVVIVLGSGLVRGRVPPLLASRLDAGARQFRRALVAGQSPVIIVSGGQGSDEPRSEAAAMAEYLTDQGLDPTAVWQETESRNTEQNLALSRELMATAGVTGRAAVVTNNFHAFRAALEMRDAKIRGYTIGAPTAGYYWPSATIREYAAILKRSRTFVIVIMAFAGLPLLLQVWYALIP